LRGDRLAAARALNAAQPLLNFQRRLGEAYLRDVFGDRSRISWRGETNGSAGSTAAFWARRIEEEGSPTFFVESIEGEQDSRMRMTGILRRYVGSDEPRRVEIAPVELLWSGVGDSPDVVQASVGAWAQEPSLHRNE